MAKSKLLKGRHNHAKEKSKSQESKESVQTSKDPTQKFEEEALKKLGGSISYIKGRKPLAI